MRLRRLVVTAFTLLALVNQVAAQPALPDFSGTWVEDEAARKTTFPTTPGGGARAMTAAPSDTVVKQTPATVTIERSFMSIVVRHVYNLNGTDSVNHNGANTMTTKSAWEGQTLVTQGTSFSVTSAGESNWIVKERRSLDKTGPMIVEMTYKDDSGKVDTTTRVFRRKK
ncbi:MAG TPA: hypothetical protein VN716_03315 [Vicinamibacterales bacterium]|nr:hypothetical protein [Vicinamibacterales bacterium]